MLVLTLRQGDYLMIGDGIKVHYEAMEGKDHLILGIDAPREVPVVRGKIYEEAIAKQAAEGDEEAKILSRKLKKDYADRQRKADIRRRRRENQERRIAAGEIKPYGTKAVSQ